MRKCYYAAPICRPDGSIDIAVRTPEDTVICTTLGFVEQDALAAISDAYKKASLIADALNAYQGRRP